MNDALLLLASARNSPLPLPEDMSLNMAAHHQLLVDSERESLLKELKSQNDLILLEHKRLLDVQFQGQMRTLLDSLQGAIKQSPPLSQGENRQSPPPSRILRTSTVYSALPKEKEKEKEEGTSGPTTQKKGVMKQLHKVYGSKLLLPHLKNESLSPRNLPPVPAPALPALQIDRCDSEGSNRRDNFDDSISKLDPCVRDFLNKTESLLLDVRKIKKKIKRKKQSSQLGDTDDFVKEDISRHPEHNLNLNLSDSPSAVGVGTSLPAIDERRKRDKITSKNISSTLDLRATTPHSSDSRGKMRDALSSSHSSRSIGKHEKRSQSPPYSDSDQECWTVLDDEKDSRQRNLIEMGWTKQQVNEGAVEHHTGEMSADYSRERTVEKNNSSHTTTEWQNELARHILSMYATTTANTNMAGSKAILEFVDTKGEVSFESVSQDLFSSEKSGDRMSNSSTGNRDGDDDSSTRSMKSDLSSIKGDQKTSIEGAISGRDKRRSRDSVTTIRDFSVPAALPRSQAHSDAEKHTQFIQKKKETVALSSSSASNSNSYGNGNGNGPSSSSGGRAVEGEAYLRLKGPPLCFPVWFVGTGDVYSDWSQLLGGALEGAKLHAQLKVLYEHREFKEYLGVVENVLNRFLKDLTALETNCRSKAANKHYAPNDSLGSLNSSQRDEEEKLLMERSKLCVLWLQLITTGVAMASLSIDLKKFDQALHILQRTQGWSLRDDILSPRQRQSCKAHVFDTYSYFFFRRKRLTAALHHAELAKSIHMRLDNNDGLAGTLLHIAAILCQQSKQTEAHKSLYHFLAMVEDGRLEFKSASPTQLCLVAVGYHNLAVIQIKMQASDLACKTSQNARKIARLCLSASTRYLTAFQRTHEAALADLKYHMEYRPAAAGYGSEMATYDNQKLHVVNNLVQNLFNTYGGIDSGVT